MKRQALFYGILVGLLLICIRCAKRGSPTGGDKDTTPPVMIKADPPNNSTNFNEKRIRIYFDEYVVLKDIQKQLIISPPLQKLPEIIPQGSASKYIDIKIGDTLQPNTTYVFNFGQSITDNNEGNPYNFFSYVFSTGNYIDSLSVSGSIQDGLNQKADDFVSVMLYEVDTTFTDSIIYKKPPTYITNTLDSTTAYTLTNLRAGKYMLVAMKDVGNNYRFNPKTDKIAFLPELINIPTDSVYALKLFKEVPPYKLSKPSLAAKNRIIFGYEGATENININLLSPKPEDFKYRILKDREKDTLHYWFTPIQADSLYFSIAHKKQIDTFSIRIKELYNDSLVLSNTVKGTLSLKKTFTIEANIPLTSINTDKISLINKDSLAIAFTTTIDTLKNQIRLVWDVQPNERYKVALFPGAVTDFFDNINDTLQYTLNTKSPADYGSVRVSLKNVKDYPIIVQLVDEKGTLNDEIYATTPQEIYSFNYLDPAKYYLRVIFDQNKNGKWDTGSYLKKLQPERVSYYPVHIDVRANWDLEEEFILK